MDEERGFISKIDPDIQEKIYVKLDDFGSAEALSEDCGFPVKTQYSVVFMLAEEY